MAAVSPNDKRHVKRCTSEYTFDPANGPQRSRVDMAPVFVSICHAYDGLRLCSGLVTTLLSAEQAKNARDFTTAASLRIGTEFELIGPFAIRLDVFTLLLLTQPTTGNPTSLVVAGAAAIGVWSLD